MARYVDKDKYTTDDQVGRMLCLKCWSRKEFHQIFQRLRKKKIGKAEKEARDAKFSEKSEK